jgi:hypothetical protein
LRSPDNALVAEFRIWGRKAFSWVNRKRTLILAASRIPGRNYNFFRVRDGVNRRQINIQMRLNEPRR